MKRLVLLLLIITVTSIGKSQDFITEWSYPFATTQIYFHALTAGGAVNYTWSATPSGNSGSGSFTQTTAGSVILSGLNIAAGDVVTLNMTPTNLRRFYIDNGVDKSYLVDVTQWGAVPWSSMETAFHGCNNLSITATDLPDLTNVTSMVEMFRGCSSLNGPNNINSWNTSLVTNMSYLFASAGNFNQDISGWNTSSVSDMNNMFSFAGSFNQNIGSWNTASVTTMSHMFGGAGSFNQDISGWDVTSVVDMSWMFANANSFNQPIGTWTTTSVTNMRYMFMDNATFNQNIDNWDVSSVTTMAYMFSNADGFIQDLNSWNTSSVKSMNYMFSDCNYNGNIGAWNTSSVLNMGGMFANNTSFNQDISGWNTSSVTYMYRMFYQSSSFDQNIGNWDVSSVTSMGEMLYSASAFNQNIGSWTLNINVNMIYMLDNSGIDCNNYSAILDGWEANNPTVTNRNLGAQNLQYGTNAENARNTLVNSRGWTISGDIPSGVTCSSALLPVEWLSFTADYENYEVILNWTVIEDVQTDFYIIQRSLDFSGWENIEKISSNSEISKISDYQIFDKYPLDGISYYRLKQTDRDGSFIYSESRVVKSESKFDFNIFPNPSNGLIYLSDMQSGSKLRISDLYGRLIFEKKIAGNKLDLGKYSAGYYFIEVIRPGGVRSYKKLQLIE